MHRISMLGAVALSALALAACGSSASKSSTTAGTLGVPSTPTTTGIGSTPATTSIGSTPTSTSVSSTPTGTGTGAAGTTTTPTATVPVGAPTTDAQFKTEVSAARAAGKSLGAALQKALENAGHMSNATFTATFTALGAQLTQYAASLTKIQPPAKYKTLYGTLARGFATVAKDVSTLGTATSSAQAKAYSTQLIKDVRKLAAPENTLDKALGLPKNGA